MARKRTLNRMDFRAEGEEGEAKEVAEDEEEDEDEDEDEEEEGEGDGDAEAEAGGDGDDDEDDGGGDDDDEDGPKKKKKAKKKVVVKKAPAKRTRAVKIVKMKAVWAVLDNASKHVETFDYKDKKAAETYALEKTDEKKSYYVQMQKVPME